MNGKILTSLNWSAVFFLTFAGLAAIATQPPPKNEPSGPAPAAAAADLKLPAGPSDAERREIMDQLQSLRGQLSRLRSGITPASSAAEVDRVADVALYERSVAWALKYEATLDAPLIEMIHRSLHQGHLRADALLAGRAPWAQERGRILRGFRSDIDGSMQPYGVVVPPGYDGSKPMRLDVVLHGSLSRWAGSAELRFEQWFKPNELGGGAAPSEDYIEVYPLGRVENGYRWAGETDIFEAIDAVSRNYNIDRDRIVLRGFSMGASGTWHVGLKHPDRFAALGPYSGYVDSRKHSEIPSARPAVIGPLPSHQDRPLSLVDAVDYAANASIVPTIAAQGGKDDAAGRNHSYMAQTMAAEGVQMVNLISPETAHVSDPVTRGKQLELISHYTAAGLNHAPRQLRFVTWSLRYSRAHWLELLELEEHYRRAEMQLAATGQDSVKVATVKNVRQFAIHPPMLQQPGATLEIDGQFITLPTTTRAGPHTWVFARRGDQWFCSGERQDWQSTGKRPGLQGPIDDAFTSAFLCVRGTGEPWHPGIGAWADASLRRFAYEWDRFMGGALPIKDDTEVTAEDLRTKHLILFGDPGSNSWIAKALPQLPVKWSREEVQFGPKRYPAIDHAPVLISPNPLPGAAGRYIVINSGHTFHAADFLLPNFVLFPRLGDWAVVKAGADAAGWAPSSIFPETVVEAGLFDEQWHVAAEPAARIRAP